MKNILATIGLAVTMLGAAAALLVLSKEALDRHACETYRQETGQWTNYINWNGCYVLIENEFLVKKEDLLPTDRPALDPEIVGMDAVIANDLGRDK